MDENKNTTENQSNGVVTEGGNTPEVTENKPSFGTKIKSFGKKAWSKTKEVAPKVGAGIAIGAAATVGILVAVGKAINDEVNDLDLQDDTIEGEYEVLDDEVTE